MPSNKLDGRMKVSKKRIKLTSYIERTLKKGENKGLGNRKEFRDQDVVYLVNLLSRHKL